MTQEQVSHQNQKQSKKTEEEVAPQEETSQESKSVRTSSAMMWRDFWGKLMAC